MTMTVNQTKMPQLYSSLLRSKPLICGDEINMSWQHIQWRWREVGCWLMSGHYGTYKVGCHKVRGCNEFKGYEGSKGEYELVMHIHIKVKRGGMLADVRTLWSMCTKETQTKVSPGLMQGSAWCLNPPSSSNHLFSLLLFLIRVKLHLFLKNVRSSFTRVLPIILIVLLSIRLIITTNSTYS